MTTRPSPEKTPDSPKRNTPKGKARFEIEGSGKALAVHLDRQGFRRLLETLERLAATGERQTFERSGRGRPGASNNAMRKLVFHIDGQG